MAGSVTITAQNQGASLPRVVRKITLAWTSTAGGAVSGTLTNYISGIIARVVFVPGSAGSQPSDLYDATLLDENGLDVLAGQGANLSNATTTHILPGVPFKDGTTTSTAPCWLDDKLELQIANAGNAKSGTVILYVG